MLGEQQITPVFKFLHNILSFSTPVSYTHLAGEEWLKTFPLQAF